MRGDRTPLTVRQLDILQFIRDFRQTEGYGPSVRDIAKGCHFHSTSTVAHHLLMLRAFGKIESAPGLARSVRVIE